MAVILLPEQGQVQSLGRVSPQQKAAAAAQPSQTAAAAFNAISQAADFGQSLLDNKKALQVSNEAIAESKTFERLSSLEFVSANELPAEVSSTLAATQQGELNDMGQMVYPQDVVGPELINFYEKTLKQKDASITNNRMRAMYARHVGQEVSVNVAKAASNIQVSQINAGRRGYIDKANAYLAGGNVESYRDVGQMAYRSGYFDRGALDDFLIAGDKAFRVQADDELLTLKDQIERAKLVGNDVTADAKIAQYNKRANLFKSQGLYDVADHNKHIRAMNQGAESTEILQDALEAFDISEAAVDSVLNKYRTNPPPNFTLEEWRIAETKINKQLGVKRAYRNRAVEETADDIKKREDMARIDALLNSPNPTIVTAEDKKAMDNVYPLNEALWRSQGGEKRVIKEKLKLIQETNYVPKLVSDQIRKGSRGTGDQMKLAGGLFNIIQNQAPEAVARIGDVSEKARLSVLGDLALSNATPEDIKSAMAKYDADNSTGAWAIRDRTYNSELKNQNSRFTDKVVDNYKTGIYGFRSTPDVHPKIEAQYGRLERLYYQSTGDMGKASELAARDLQATWGMYKGALMEMPPIKISPLSEAQSEAYFTRNHSDIPTENLRLQTDGFTLYSGSTNPSYLVVSVDSETGLTTPIQQDDGAFVRWRYNPQDTNEYKQNIKIQAAVMQSEEYFQDTLLTVEAQLDRIVEEIPPLNPNMPTISTDASANFYYRPQASSVINEAIDIIDAELPEIRATVKPYLVVEEIQKARDSLKVKLKELEDRYAEKARAKYRSVKDPEPDLKPTDKLRRQRAKKTESEIIDFWR